MVTAGPRRRRPSEDYTSYPRLTLSRECATGHCGEYGGAIGRLSDQGRLLRKRGSVAMTDGSIQVFGSKLDRIMGIMRYGWAEFGT